MTVWQVGIIGAYLVAPTRTASSQAPPGCDNIKILPHIPYINEEHPYTRQDCIALKELCIDKLQRMGLTDLRKHIVVEYCWTPFDIEQRYGSNRGSIYGVVCDRTRNFAFKAPKRSPTYRNLFFRGCKRQFRRWNAHGHALRPARGTHDRGAVRKVDTMIWLAVACGLGLPAGLLLLWRVPLCSADPGARLRSISIVIPARNEERNLPRLLKSLWQPEPHPQEVVVVDDASTDATAFVAAKLGARVVASLPVPPGWTGKTWACFQGAAAASSPWLLFLDA